MSIPERNRPWSGSQANTVKNFRWWYEALIDWQLANPGKQLAEAARHFNRSQTTISLIVNSDIYRVRYAQRRKALADQLNASIIHKNTQVAVQALDIVSERIAKNPEKIPTGMLMDFADKALERLGYGVQPQVQGGVVITNNVVVPVKREVLEEARQTIRQLEATSVASPSESRDLVPTKPERELDDVLIPGD